MQDEVTKHTRKIFGIMKNAKQSFSGKIKEITIEILIIVFAVTVSIWLHSWSQHSHQQKEVKEFLADIKEDIKDNIKTMTEAKETLSRMANNFGYLDKIDEVQYDSIVEKFGSDTVIANKFGVEIIIRRNTNGNYEGFKSSGKIGYIENKKLKKLILAYYQQDIPSFIEVDNYYNQLMKEWMTCMIDEDSKTMKEFFFTTKINRRITFIHKAAIDCGKSYDEGIKSAKAIIAEIDKENLE